MAKKKARRLHPGDAKNIELGSMFGTEVQKVIFVRPVPKSKGGGAMGDEVGTLVYRRAPNGNRGKGAVIVEPYDIAFKRFKEK